MYSAVSRNSGRTTLTSHTDSTRHNNDMRPTPLHELSHDIRIGARVDREIIKAVCTKVRLLKLGARASLPASVRKHAGGHSLYLDVERKSQTDFALRAHAG